MIREDFEMLDVAEMTQEEFEVFIYGGCMDLGFVPCYSKRWEQQKESEEQNNE